jgi:hypothetical protein
MSAAPCAARSRIYPVRMAENRKRLAREWRDDWINYGSEVANLDALCEDLEMDLELVPTLFDDDPVAFIESNLQRRAELRTQLQQATRELAAARARRGAIYDEAVARLPH